MRTLNHGLSTRYGATEVLLTPTQTTIDYLNAVILSQSSPEEAFRRLDEVGNKYIDSMRKLAMEIEAAKDNGEPEKARLMIPQFEDILDKYDPLVSLLKDVASSQF